jgi:hypothetical protein
MDAAPPPPPVGYPAPHPPAPQVTSAGGPVMTAPVIVPIVFPNDAYQSDIAAFTSGIGATGTAYWSVIDEYGVGPATAKPVIVVTDAAPTMIDDSAIQPWIASNIASNVLPAPTPDTIYAIFYPEQTTVTLQGATSCMVFGGYHNSFQTADGTPFSYAVVPRCPNFNPALVGVDEVTGAASHEFMEAATDPLPETQTPSYNVLDQDHLIWGLLGSELADMCAQNPDAFFLPTGFQYDVQRLWSDKEAAASHDPCVPSAGGPYFNSVPVLTDTVILSGAIGGGQTQGVNIPVGQSQTIEVDLFSDAPTSGPWAVTAIDLTPDLGLSTQQTLSFAFNTSSGQNGDKLQLTITVDAASMYGVEVFMLVSALGNTERLWFGAVGN